MELTRITRFDSQNDRDSVPPSRIDVTENIESLTTHGSTDSMTESTKIQTATHVALLAPVPLEHLIDGRVTSERVSRVAFGSMRWDFFRDLDQSRKGMPVDVFIYASHTDGYPEPETTWRAKYLRHVESVGGAHPDGMRYRPPSTAKYSDDNSGHWAVFWEVTELEPVSAQQRLQLADLTGFGKKKAYGHPFVPEGPLLIEHP
jgi:hypothetical protein